MSEGKSETLTWLMVLNVWEMTQREGIEEALAFVASPKAERDIALLAAPEPPEGELRTVLGMKVYVTTKLPPGVQAYIAPAATVERWRREGKI